MFSFSSLSSNASRRAAQLFITIVIILLLGKIIAMVPVMQQLQLADTFTAAEIVWFIAKLTSLVVFFLFARYLIEAIPNNGGVLSFVKGVSVPLTVLLVIILGQALLWKILAPFSGTVGKTIYNSVAIILIVCVSIWFILRAYRDSFYIVDATKKVGKMLSRFTHRQQATCDQCHAEIATNAIFCSQCGHELKKALFCPECGEVISDDQSFCQSCGSKISEVTKIVD